MGVRDFVCVCVTCVSVCVSETVAKAASLCGWLIRGSEWGEIRQPASSHRSVKPPWESCGRLSLLAFHPLVVLGTGYKPVWGNSLLFDWEEYGILLWEWQSGRRAAESNWILSSPGAMTANVIWKKKCSQFKLKLLLLKEKCVTGIITSDRWYVPFAKMLSEWGKWKFCFEF